MANPRTYVEAPPVTPLPYGLNSVALVLDDLEGPRALGVHYEPAYCGPVLDTTGACEEAPDFGSVSVSIDSTGNAVLTATGAPSGTLFSIDWGDGTTPASTGTLTGSAHEYLADGTYVVLVLDDRLGYHAQVTVTYAGGSASGPFVADASFSKVPVVGIDLVDGAPFGLYHLFHCQAVGAIDDMAERARAALRLGEPRAIERVTASMLPLREGAVDLTPTPGTAVHPARGVAILEDFAGIGYGGVPVIHASRLTGSLLTTAGTVIRSGARLETVLGSLVGAGAGYSTLAGPPTDAGDPTTIQPAAPGTAWLYVTGQVVVRRSPTIEVGPLMSTTPATNVAEMLVERLATVSWECITGAVLVDTTVVDA